MPTQRSSGTLMPTETAPPEAVRDPKLWEQWQQHGQYEYERGYEAGRKDAMAHRRADMREDRAPYPSIGDGTQTRMSERYEGPSFDRPSAGEPWRATNRSEEHTSDLQSLLRTSNAVFCSKKKKRSAR